MLSLLDTDATPAEQGSTPTPHVSSTQRLFRILHLIEKVARALHHAHEAGLVHRDIKPGNVMVTPEGEPVVLDFGLVWIDDAEHDSLTLTGEKLGTPAYMSPEQVEPRGRQRPDRRTDVYSLGATLFECLTLRCPFEGLTRETLYREILSTPVPNPARLNSAIPRDVRIVLETALEKDPDRRYQTCQDFADDLQRIRERRPIVARRLAPHLRALRWIQRNAIASAFVAVLMVGLGATLWQFAAAKDNANRLAAKIGEFDLLAGVVKLEEAKAAAEHLHPAWPETIEAMERWQRQLGRPVLAMRVDLKRTVQGLEQRAPPQSEAEKQAERRSHPRYAEWKTLSAKLAALQRARGLRAGKIELRPPELPVDLREKTAQELHQSAWEILGGNDDRRRWGQEALALSVARAALAKADASDDPALRANLLDTMAWALLANGQDDEALTYGCQALEAWPEGNRSFGASRLRNLEMRIEGWHDGSVDEELNALERQLGGLEAEIDVRRNWGFEDEATRFLHRTLTQLLVDLDAFETGEFAEVAQRLSWARRIAELTRGHPNARVSWSEAHDAILAADDIVASALYAHDRLELSPQLGLVPIGTNPVTRLWEFYHLASAWDPRSETDPAELPIPTHEPDGSIEIAESTGIVFVLVPGGTFLMGAQRQDPLAPSYDPQADRLEAPVHEVTLAPFFVARHELTQGQWSRMSRGELPSYFQKPRPLDHPVESVSWQQCQDLLTAYGLELPTEAQWEYACRAGTSTPWWTGEDRESLVRDGLAVNLADQFARRRGARWPSIDDWPTLDDGYGAHAPVDTMRANPWGLHHVHGNVFEWCRDLIGSYTEPPRSGDGLRPEWTSIHRVARSGCFNMHAANVRSSFRWNGAPTYLADDLGLRAARSVRH